MITTKILENLKLVLFIALICLVIWFYKDYRHQVAENIRQTENVRQTRIADSIKFSTQNLTPEELKEHLEYENKALKQKLEQDKIKLSRIEQIVSTYYKYSDSNTTNTDLDSILKAVNSLTAREQEIIDTSKCLTVKGKVIFDGKKLSLQITDREFKNNMDAVAYWERKEWKFFGIKTRFLGKKQFTAKTYNDCGESGTVNIKVQKK